LSRRTNQTMATAYKNKKLNAFTLIHSNTFIYLHTHLLYYTAYSVFCYNVRLRCHDETLPRREYLLSVFITFVALINRQRVHSLYRLAGKPYHIFPVVYPFFSPLEDEERVKVLIDIFPRVSPHIDSWSSFTVIS
jgi:hypothetical protein